MNTAVYVEKDTQTSKLENPSLYTQASGVFSEICRLLEENNIHVQDNMHMGQDFVEAMILVVQKDFPEQANLFYTAYSRLSQQDKKTFRVAYIQPFILIPFRKRMQKLLAHKG